MNFLGLIGAWQGDDSFPTSTVPDFLQALSLDCVPRPGLTEVWEFYSFQFAYLVLIFLP